MQSDARFSPLRLASSGARRGVFLAIAVASLWTTSGCRFDVGETTRIVLDPEHSRIQVNTPFGLQRRPLQGALELQSLSCESSCSGRLQRFEANGGGNEVSLRSVHSASVHRRRTRLTIDDLELTLFTSSPDWLPPGRFSPELPVDWYFEGGRLEGSLRLPREGSAPLEVILSGSVESRSVPAEGGGAKESPSDAGSRFRRDGNAG